jgi:hypothetical protein
MDEDDIFDNSLYELEDAKKILDIVKIYHDKSNVSCMLEGNCFYHHLTYDKMEEKRNTRYNLWKCGKLAKNCLEIGFNAGHSAMLFLNSNPDIKIKSYDIAWHPYTIPCAIYLKQKYNLELVIGDSLQTTFGFNPNEKYDLIHVDGGHSTELAFKDIINCRVSAHPDTLLIVDDTDFPNIDSILTVFLQVNMLKEVDYEKLELRKSPSHRIFHYIQ